MLVLVKNLIRLLLLISTVYVLQSKGVTRMFYTHYKYSNFELHKYVIKFKKLTKSNKKILIGFNFIDKELAGRCYPRSILYKKLIPEIDINPTYWQTLNEKSKDILVFHELMHCLCGIYKHSDELFPDYCQKSIMATSMPSFSCIERYYQDYIIELKRRCK